ncbi:hypothetical protein XA68_14131 [Ophiocordyceps unilateralis]|uniref:AB hydrolase-1 domain-containing protein n=1 Tax=Ophiocordyceps unilateralis TaxID=268505 RepID=A0A2A9PBB2_OPHUN|nr:hypothetical protein XA68_14131 [Ophiocordyceps unilateralis]
MGLAGVMATWQYQTLYFGHERGHRFSVLLLDNRGMGLSDRPLMRYSTSEMARDVMEVLDHVGWRDRRQVHVVGISLGGMIAQELACLIPQRISSLSLISTAAHLRGGDDDDDDDDDDDEGDASRRQQYTSTLAHAATAITDRLSMLKPRSEEETIFHTSRLVFVPQWLSAPDQGSLPNPDSTPRCQQPATTSREYGRFHSNFQRYQAQELVKRRGPGFSRLGYLCQAVAAVWHWKSHRQLRSMADDVGRKRILVMHGRHDLLIRLRFGLKLIDALEPAVVHVVDGMGHGPCVEREAWFNRTLEENLDKWQGLDDDA